MTDISLDTAIANLSGALAATLANRFGRVANLIDDFGAVGDGVTNDTTSIQNAITACAGKAILLFPAGYTYAVNTLNIPSNSQFLIGGTLYLLSNTNSSLLRINYAAENIYIQGFGSASLNGNASGQTGSSFVSAGIDNNPNISNVYVASLTITNFFNWPFNITRCTNGWLRDCILSSSGSSVEFASECINCHISGNTVFGIRDEGIAIYGGCVNCSVSENVVYNCNSSGISILNDVAQPTPCSGINIFSNVCYSNGLSGIEANSGASATGQHTNIIISSNICYANNTGLVAPPGGFGAINIGDVHYFKCDGNIVYGTYAPSNSSPAVVAGIYIGPQSGYGSISNNVCYNQGVSYQGIGITIVGYDIVCSNNFIYNTSGTGPTVIGIQVEGGFTTNLNNTILAVPESYILNSAYISPSIASFYGTNGGYTINAILKASSPFLSYGLTIGTGINAVGEVDFVLGPGTYGEAVGQQGANWFQLNTSGTIQAGPFSGGAIMQLDGLGNLGASSYKVGGSSGPTWTSGVGAPTTTQPNGSIYSNTSGTAGARLYVSTGSGWNPVPGV
jgi:hypothetical protein